MAQFQELSQSNISVSNDSFIYTIVSLPNSGDNVSQFAAISSDDSLTFFGVVSNDSNAKSIAVNNIIRPVQDGVTCVHMLGDNVVTAGRDGKIKLWDPAQPNGQGISALACHPEGSLVVAGTSYEEEGLGRVGIFIWTFENTASPQLVRSYTDSHTDTITQVHFISYPNLPVALLSASTDGLINIFDFAVEDEDDAVVEVLNNHGAINYTCPTAQGVWAITHDELMSYHAFAGEASQGEEKLDLREKFACDYAVKLLHNKGKMMLVVGANKAETTSTTFADVYNFPAHASAPVDFQHVCRLSGAHGEEVVRDVSNDDTHALIISCGEDGLVRLWGQVAAVSNSDIMEVEADNGGLTLSAKEKRKKKAQQEANRFQPY